MTEGQVKAKLNQYLEARHKFDNARNRLEETEALLTSISIDYTKDRVTSSPKTLDRIGELIDRLSELRSECMAEAWSAVRTMEEVTEFIKKVGDSRLEGILVRHYILGDSFEKIANEMEPPITERHVYRLQDEAIGRLR